MKVVRQDGSVYSSAMEEFERGQAYALNYGNAEGSYEDRVVFKIRQRYSLSEELAILRQRDTKPQEFKAYNDYAEQCKAEVKSEMPRTEEGATI